MSADSQFEAQVWLQDPEHRLAMTAFTDAVESIRPPVKALAMAYLALCLSDMPEGLRGLLYGTMAKFTAGLELLSLSQQALVGTLDLSVVPDTVPDQLTEGA